MSGRIKLITHEGSIELQINPLKSRKFLYFGLFLIVCLTGSLIYALSTTQASFLPYAILLWALGCGIIVYLQICNQYGKIIVCLDQKSLSIKDEVKGLGITKKFPTNDISNLRLAGFFDKVSTPVLSGWLQFKFYDGKIAFDYKNKTYRFGNHITDNDAIEVAEKFKNYIKAVQYDSRH